MTERIVRTLEALIPDPPADLVALYASPRSVRPDLDINVLPLAEAVTYTRAVRRTAIGHALGLFVLDDADDSNPFCYVGLGPAAGCIVHLLHDEGPRICYASLADFLAALDAAIEEDLHIDELPGKNRRPRIEQRYLVRRIVKLNSDRSAAAECELLVLIPVLDSAETATIDLLSHHPSSEVREALADLVASHPHPNATTTAERLADDRNQEVASAGKRARAAVRALRQRGQP